VNASSHTGEVLFFTTPHCSICRAVRPTVNEVAGSFEGRVRFREVDAVSDADAAARYGVKGVPTLIAVHGNKSIRRMVGSGSQRQIADVFTAASSGVGSRGLLARNDRILRLGIAAVFGVAAVLSGQPVLWVLAAGATVSALWDLARP